jgi:hypothetical protein
VALAWARPAHGLCLSTIRSKARDMVQLVMRSSALGPHTAMARGLLCCNNLDRDDFEFGSPTPEQPGLAQNDRS